MLEERSVETLRGPGAWGWVLLGLIIGLALIIALARWQRQRAQEQEVEYVPPSPVEAEMPTVEEAAGEKKSEPDDLKVIEGIGPKIEQLLYEAGIRTYAQLAATPPDRLREILEAAGPRFRLADPTTWPEQAALAAAGRWDELSELQASLKGGRRVT